MLENIPLEPSWETVPQTGLLEDLADRGWSVVEQFLPPLLIAQLAGEIQVLQAAGRLNRAGIGRGREHRIASEVRTDQVSWLDPSHCSAVQRSYLDAMEALRLAVNRRLFLGLYDFEAHLVLYPPGSYYRKHLDRIRGTEHRILSAILYLNQGWSAEDGGQLRLYTDPTDESRFEELLPLAGRLLIFLSDRFVHEVMPARRDRLSITGWFRQRDTALPLS